MIAHFNDADPANCETLRREIDALPGRHLLRRKPQVFNHHFPPSFGREVRETRLRPSLFFVDPFGYSGLTQDLIQGVLKDWGCEVIFFFNFNRVNAAVTNTGVAHHIDHMFGEREAHRLRRRVEELPASAREDAVMQHLVAGIREGGMRYVQQFAFANRQGVRTSHYLIHVTKHRLGSSIMKDVMGRASSWAKDGVPSFACGRSPEPTLFDDCASPLDDLKASLRTEYAGRSVEFSRVVYENGLERRFTEKNFRDALLHLEKQGRVSIDCPVGRRRRAGTLPERAVVHFPPLPVPV